jgi:L-alanine-DL-glutamate epimerase-like enolase superfamily enzyme
MLISQVGVDLVRLPMPLPRPCALPRAESGGPLPPESIAVLLVRLETDDGLTGLGFVHDLTPNGCQGRLGLGTVETVLGPRVIGADPRLRERLFARLHHESPGNFALAAVDIALWDLAARAAGLPLWQFLGGSRDAAPAYLAETARPGLSGEQILALYESARAKGTFGLHVAVGGPSPEADARKLESVRNEIGLDVWLGVTAHGAYDAGTGLAMGRFLEEETDADWFEDPAPADDRAGLRRLAGKLEVPVAIGSRFDRISDFTSWLSETDAGVVRPDPVRLGGLTPAVQVMHLAAAFQRPAVPVLLPEVAIHLACGLPGARAVDYVSWLEPLWQIPPAVAGGSISPPPGPGLGLELNTDAVARFRVAP